jgi:hypothetical protein
MSWMIKLAALMASYPLSGLMSGGILLAAAIFQWRMAVRGQTGFPSPAGMDLLGKTLLDAAPNSKVAPAFVSLLWFLVCFLVEIVFPLLPHRAAGWEIVKKLPVVLAVDYVILVPILLWCYMSIAQDLRETGQSDSARSTGRILWWALLWLACLVFQYITIRTQIGSCSSTPPWLWVESPPVTCGSVLQLNWQGEAHAALRGLDAMMALGLAATVICAAVRGKEIGGSSVLEAHGSWESRHGYIQCNASLRRLSIHLLLAGVFAIAIAGLHFITIEMHRNMMDPNESTSASTAQFVGSTYVIWAAIAIVWGSIAMWIIFGVDRRARQELRDKEAAEIDRVLRSLPEQLQQDIRGERVKASIPENQTRLDEYWRDHDTIRKFYTERSNPYPLPMPLRFRWIKNPLMLNLLAGVMIAIITQGLGGWAIDKAAAELIDRLLPADPYIPCGLSCLT